MKFNIGELNQQYRQHGTIHKALPSEIHAYPIHFIPEKVWLEEGFDKLPANKVKINDEGIRLYRKGDVVFWWDYTHRGALKKYPY